MDFATTYRLGEQSRRTALRARCADGSVDAGALLVGRVRPQQPLVLHHDSGSQAMDLVGTTALSVMLVSDRVVVALELIGARGWSTYPVQLFDRHGTQLTGYHGFAVQGRAGPLQKDGTHFVALPPTVPGGPAMYEERGWAFDPASWDGSDVFVPEGVLAPCVTERVRRECVAAGLTNLAFTPFATHFVNLHSTLPPGRTTGAA